MRIACQYAIVRFLPFLETGEFANVGVVLFAPKKGYWDYKLAPATFPRVTQFFGEIDRKVYRKAMQGFNDEMAEIQELAGQLYGKELLEFGREVTRLRESLLRFGELRTLLTDNPQQTMEELYDQFVGRNFVDKDYREEKMARAIKHQLQGFKLEKQYTKKTFEAKLRKITLPLVRQADIETRVMKPLAFDHKNPSKLIEHGELWKNKIQWLLENNVLDEDKILLPIEAPNTLNSDLKEAYEIALHDLETLNIELIAFEDTQRIIDFAREGLRLNQLN